MLYRVDQFKSQFFDRDIIGRLDQLALRGLSRFGAFVRRSAQSSMRKARRKTLAELTGDERQRFRIATAIAQRTGQPRPKRPLAPSKPGEPPRVRSGEVKKFLFFAYEPQSRSVVIGPARLGHGTGAPENLEHGGHVRVTNGRARIAPRPYMDPAFQKNLHALPRMLALGN